MPVVQCAYDQQPAVVDCLARPGGGSDDPAAVFLLSVRGRTGGDEKHHLVV